MRKGPPKSPRLPFEPLIPIIEARWREPNCTRETSYNTNYGLPRKAADVTGMARNTMIRGIRYGLTPEMADRVAVSLGYHPSNIWPGEWNGLAA